MNEYILKARNKTAILSNEYQKYWNAPKCLFWSLTLQEKPENTNPEMHSLLSPYSGASDLLHCLQTIAFPFTFQHDFLTDCLIIWLHMFFKVLNHYCFHMILQAFSSLALHDCNKAKYFSEKAVSQITHVEHFLEASVCSGFLVSSSNIILLVH